VSDVTAVCLTLGEKTTERALESIARQTLPVADTIVVEGVQPFHRAFNLAAARVETPFFVQVDADMVLDPTCVADLRAAIHPEAAIAAGLLRDPLLGKLPAVKLFRSAALAGQLVPDTIAPDVDQYHLLRGAGWLTLFVLGRRGRRLSTRYTFGEHRPTYDAAYTYGTYHLLGSRYRYQRDRIAFGWRQARLRRSGHAMARLARLALGEGLFAHYGSDVAKTHPGSDGADFLEELLAGGGREHAASLLEGLLEAGDRDVFEGFYELGLSGGRDRLGAAVRQTLDVLSNHGGEHAWIAEIGFARGVLSHGRTATVTNDWAELEQTLIRGRIRGVPDASQTPIAARTLSTTFA
jgi:hypothetical protein